MAKALDLTGKRFGILTAIEKAYSEKGRSVWLCRCDCGNEVTRRGDVLQRSGENASCGCLRKREDLSGYVFGELTVLRFDMYYKKSPKWLCKCSCGKEIYVFANGLKSGFTKNCGSAFHSKHIGEKFGRLTVLPDAIPRNGSTSKKYLCRCDCGKYTYVTISNLMSGNTRSCGCYNKEITAKRASTHNMSHSKLFGIWWTMLQRCKNEKVNSYKNYGGRGIKVCEEWQTFEPFYEWSMSHGYADDLSIDRVDNDGDYCPKNCRWTTFSEQANNRRNTVWVYYNGEKKTISQLAKENGVKYKALYYMYKNKNMSIEDALRELAIRQSKEG